MRKEFLASPKKWIKEAALVVTGLIILTVAKTAEICIAVAGLTYFWKEMLLPDIYSGSAFKWCLIPVLVLIATIVRINKKNLDL